MEEPELVTLIPEEDSEGASQSPEIGRKLLTQIVVVVVLKVATGIAIRKLADTIREFDVLYPEHLNRVRWRDFS
jgi:hypothetical protein